MDRAFLSRHLVQAEQHVTLGEQRVWRQRELVAHLARAGLNTIQAEYLLLAFEQALAIYMADRDRIQAELARPAEWRR